MADVSDLGSTTAGVWSRADACAVMTRGQVDTAVRTGRWQAPWPGVYADGGVVLDALQRAVTAVLASGGVDQAVACGRTAARVWELPLVDDDDPATRAREHRFDEVAVHAHKTTLRRGSRVLQRRRLTLDVDEVLRLEHGLRLTSPVRTLRDLYGRIGDAALVCALDHALHRDVVTAERLLDGAGSRFAQIVGLADGRAESPGESLLRLLLLPRLPGLVPQVRLRDRGGQVVARFDLGDEALRLAVECDGRRGHAGELMVAKDRQRDVVAAQLGWTTERVTWFDVRCRPQATVERIVRTAERLATRPA